MSITIDQQIAAIQRAVDDRNNLNRGKVSRGQMDQSEATADALALDAGLASLQWLRKNEHRIKAAIRKGGDDEPST